MKDEDLSQEKLLTFRQQIERLGSPDRDLRREAFKALERQGQVILDAAIEGLNHPNPKIRADCADLMDHLADDRCIEPLMEATQDPVPRVRRRAVHSLNCDRCKPSPLSADLVPLLIDIVVNDDNAKVRHEAAYGLAVRSPDKRMLSALETVANKLTAKESLSKPERVLLRNVKIALKRNRQSMQKGREVCTR